MVAKIDRYVLYMDSTTPKKSGVSESVVSPLTFSFMLGKKLGDDRNISHRKRHQIFVSFFSTWKLIFSYITVGRKRKERKEKFHIKE
jgi:hypothetical protein